MSVILVLVCIYLNATVCGFLHPEIFFETHIVEVPIDEDTSVLSGSDEKMPTAAPGTEILGKSNTLAEEADTFLKAM